jgi:hypothetical protein
MVGFGPFMSIPILAWLAISVEHNHLFLFYISVGFRCSSRLCVPEGCFVSSGLLAQVSNDEGKQIVFSSVPAEANAQTRQVRGVLHGLGATPGIPVTILSDGADGPRSLGEAASPGPTHHVLDSFHLAMRVQHVAQAATSWPDATEVDRQAGARLAETIERIRWRLWGVVQTRVPDEGGLTPREPMRSARISCVLVENLNSRLRTYFTLRRHLGNSYLDLLRFFLNHRRFMRSRRGERHGKSPREVMTGQGHPHWLTLLGLGPLQPQRA